MSRSAAVLLGVLVLAVAGGGWAYAGSRGSGRITVCVQKHGGELYEAARCAAGDKRLSWNIAGPRGWRGVRGPQGVPGLQFMTASGADGPFMTGPGTYFVEVEADIPSGSGANPVLAYQEPGVCDVQAVAAGAVESEFNGTFVNGNTGLIGPAAHRGNSTMYPGATYSFTGMFVLPAHTVAQARIAYCGWGENPHGGGTSNFEVFPSNVRWWVAQLKS